MAFLSKRLRFGRAALGALPCALILTLETGCKESSANAPAPATDGAGAIAARCGGEGEPECPTQHWMKATLQAYLRTRDFNRLEASFKSLAERAPKGYDGWQRMAEDGASAAKAKDEGRIRSTCQECHDQHRARFREELRSVELL